MKNEITILRKYQANIFTIIVTSLIILLILLGGASLLMRAIIPETGDASLNVDGAQGKSLPTLNQFVNAVKTDDPDLMVGIYAEGIFADRIVHQPQGSWGTVIAEPEEVTLFHLAEEQKTLGLLAHNYLAGHSFFELQMVDRIYLILGDGTKVPFVVSEIHEFQALDPRNARTNFINLDTGEKEAAADVFVEMYDRQYDMVLQTCIDRDGNSEWGRRFIIATPVLEEIDLDDERVNRLR